MVHLPIHKCRPTVLVLSQLDPVHKPTSWRPFIILSSYLSLGLPSGLFHSGFSTKTLHTPLLSPMCATCPAISFSILSPERYWYRSLRSSLPKGIIHVHKLNTCAVDSQQQYRALWNPDLKLTAVRLFWQRIGVFSSVSSISCWNTLKEDLATNRTSI